MMIQCQIVAIVLMDLLPVMLPYHLCMCQRNVGVVEHVGLGIESIA